MAQVERIAFEEGKIVAQMIGLTGKPVIPTYYAGDTAEAFMRGYGNERRRMEQRVARATLA